MTFFEFTKWVHILSSTVLFGTGLGTAFHMWVSHRRGSVEGIALAARNTVTADWLFTLPAGLVQPFTGLVLIYLTGRDPWESWLVATYILYMVALSAWIPVVMLQIKAATLAHQASVDGTELPAAYFRAMRIWFWLGWPGFTSLVTIFALMVTKPPL